PSLALALLVLYESIVNERPVQSAEQDRARMTRLADAYRARGGPSLALVDTWVTAATRKRGSMRRDLQVGLRSLAARPAFAVVSILSLALGITATAAIYNALHAA